ncbi:MAG: ImmA/IrrE family metallo-endopeptidase [Oscillospiraceae bacterium]
MDISTRKLIDEIANSVRKMYSVPMPISDISKIVELIGGVVKYDDAELSELSDGYIKKTSDGSFEICVSSKCSLERRNFTVAHEIGHLFLHMGYRTNPELWKSVSDDLVYNRSGQSDEEYQANEFAAAFLMPEDTFVEVLKRNSNGNTVNMASVANYFGVSVEAAVTRGKWLGYLRW